MFIVFGLYVWNIFVIILMMKLFISLKNVMNIVNWILFIRFGSVV